eukprot:9485430-Pyramimonas_sp.AAC.1
MSLRFSGPPVPITARMHSTPQRAWSRNHNKMTKSNHNKMTRTIRSGRDYPTGRPRSLYTGGYKSSDNIIE